MENKEAYIRLGARIKALRTAKGFSIDELAERAGIQPVTLVNIERGLFAIKYELLIAIAEALDMKLDFLPKE